MAKVNANELGGSIAEYAPYQESLATLIDISLDSNSIKDEASPEFQAAASAAAAAWKALAATIDAYSANHLRAALVATRQPAC